MPDQKQLKNVNYSERILSSFQDFKNDNVLSDIILIAGQSQYHCHKVILAASSPYFKAMFTSALKESRDNAVEFTEMSGHILDEIVNYVYSGIAEVNRDNAQELLTAAHLLQFNEIVEACCDFLRAHLHPSNCLGIEWLSRLHSLPKLEAEAQNYAIENFDRVLDYDEFLKLPDDRLQWYLQLSEIDLYTNLEVSDNVPPCEINPRPSTLAKDVIVLLGNDPETGLGMMYAFEPLRERWSALSDAKGLPCVLDGVAITTVGNNIFITGGIRDEEIVSEVWCFSSKDRKWISLPNLKKPRALHSCASHNNQIFVISGTDNIASMVKQSVPHETIERLDLKDTVSNGNSVKLDGYDLAKLEWEEIAKISYPRIKSMTICYKETLIEVGGYQFSIPVKKLEVYNCSFKNPGGANKKSPTLSKKLSQSLSFYGAEQYILPEPIEHGRMVSVNDDLYILWQDAKKFISLNPEKKNFQNLARPCSHSTNSSLVVIGNRIYLIGCHVDTGREDFLSIEYFDVESCDWCQTASIRRALRNIQCAVVKMRCTYD
ncbi:hypothetical protein HELRODRAFT_171137 [Helobdella robusta]|uniref:BTB domain-containing protein n=1 Tax=Helobdella robusta TaxID=6412 RepID=T1F3U5_HELRO|nr:hypothetical protein HELRODRAFT_171137 [Helobdella robusta]ESO05500.1 hypothetical protein HELRODRAFT_171137 [Helobdella robusta]